MFELAGKSLQYKYTFWRSCLTLNLVFRNFFLHNIFLTYLLDLTRIIYISGFKTPRITLYYYVYSYNLLSFKSH